MKNSPRRIDSSIVHFLKSRRAALKPAAWSPEISRGDRSARLQKRSTRIIGRTIETQSAPEWREQIQSLLDSLDSAHRMPEREGRRSARMKYRALDLIVYVLNERSKTTSRLQVHARNISTGGLAFLHKQMLAMGTKLRIEIPMIDERQLEVLANVTRCRHVKGMVHEIGVAFTQSHTVSA